MSNAPASTEQSRGGTIENRFDKDYAANLPPSVGGMGGTITGLAAAATGCCKCETFTGLAKAKLTLATRTTAMGAKRRLRTIGTIEETPCTTLVSESYLKCSRISTTIVIISVISSLEDSPWGKKASMRASVAARQPQEFLAKRDSRARKTSRITRSNP